MSVKQLGIFRNVFTKEKHTRLAKEINIINIIIINIIRNLIVLKEALGRTELNTVVSDIHNYPISRSFLVGAFFNLLIQLIDRFKFPAGRIYNVDEILT